MLQRVGLAQSLINAPEIVFMDEPMSGLDPMGRREVRELIAGLRDKGTTVFMSTHILSDVEALCDEVAILRKGTLAAAGKLEDLLASEDQNRAFEIQFRGVSAAELESSLSEVPTLSINGSGMGSVVQVAGETEVESVIKLARSAGGTLVSVNGVKQSLEDLFVRETA
jgi:ABC-2 type transport system ATP-binding protein